MSSLVDLSEVHAKGQLRDDENWQLSHGNKADTIFQLRRIGSHHLLSASKQKPHTPENKEYEALCLLQYTEEDKL